MTAKEKILANDYLQKLKAEMFIRFWDKAFVNAVINSLINVSKKVDIKQVEYDISLI